MAKLSLKCLEEDGVQGLHRLIFELLHLLIYVVLLRIK